eukprot:6220775-Pyramimonas_sp.AAC.1
MPATASSSKLETKGTLPPVAIGCRKSPSQVDHDGHPAEGSTDLVALPFLRAPLGFAPKLGPGRQRVVCAGRGHARLLMRQSSDLFQRVPRRCQLAPGGHFL